MQLKMKEEIKPLLKIAGIIIAVILTIYFISYLGGVYFSSKYDKGVAEHLMKNKNLLSQKKSDTIYVTDADFNECSQDTRGFIDKQYTRPAIRNHLKNLGYKAIIFADNNPEISINGGQPFSIPAPIVRPDKPCYGLHIWTETYGLIPKYNIAIEETYFNLDSIFTNKSSYKYTITGLDETKCAHNIGYKQGK